MRHHPAMDLMPLAVATVLFVLTLVALLPCRLVADPEPGSGRGAIRTGALR